MAPALRQRVTVKPGGVIEIRSPDLQPGTTAEVIVLPASAPPRRHSLASCIGMAKGLFATPQDADEFLRRERDAWES